MAARARGIRLARSPFPQDLHAAFVIQQRVQFSDAARSHHRLVWKLGERAPGPFEDLWIFPDHASLRRLPSWGFFEIGIESKLRTALVEAVRLGERLQKMEPTDFAAARRFLRAIRGTGPWAAENVMGYGLADPDAVPTGDVHLPHVVAFALAGERWGSDERMLELLEPYCGQRFRVLRWILLEGPTRPYIDSGRTYRTRFPRRPFG